MSASAPKVFKAINMAALRTASLLTPCGRRADWLKEWRSELWHVRQLCGAEHEVCWPAEREVAAFCLGAFQDALCLRRQSPAPRISLRSYVSPATRCVLALAGLAGGLCWIAMSLPGARSAARPELYRDTEGLMLITSSGYTATEVATIRAGQFRLWKDRNQHLFDSFAFYRPLVKSVAIAPHHSEEMTVAQSSKNLFELLGMKVMPANDHDGAQPVLPKMILTEDAWKRSFGGDTNIAGRIVRIGLRKVEIAGVIPFQQWKLPGQIDAWLLEPDDAAAAIPSNARGFLIGHLDPSPERPRFTLRFDMAAPAISGHREDFTCVTLAARTQDSPFSIFLFSFLLSLLALPATTSLPLGEYPATHHKLPQSRRFLRWGFLAAKIALIVPIVYFGSLDLAYYRTSLSPESSAYLQLISCFCTSLFALRWALRDQRQRCPVCLSKLTHPARVGQPSRNFLAWNGTELICAGGHGLLHVPEIATSWFSTQRWLYLDPSWDVLFPQTRLVSPILPG